MPKLPSLTSKQVLAILRKEGFEVDHTTGSHYILYHSSTRARVTLPFHRKDLPRGTLYSILKQAGLSQKDLQKYL